MYKFFVLPQYLEWTKFVEFSFAQNSFLHSYTESTHVSVI